MICIMTIAIWGIFLTVILLSKVEILSSFPGIAWIWALCPLLFFALERTLKRDKLLLTRVILSTEICYFFFSCNQLLGKGTFFVPIGTVLFLGLCLAAAVK